MSVKAILTEQQKSYTKAEEDALFANYYDKDYIDTYMAPLDTPTFIGVPKAPTAAAGTNTTQIATTAFVYDGLQRKSNKNLLRNWYFVGGGTGRGVFPVNSRGQSSYGSGIFNIDGYKTWRATVDFVSTGIKICSTVADQIGTNYQVVANSNELLGKTITISGLVDGVLIKNSATIPSSYSSTTIINASNTIVLSMSASGEIRFELQVRITEGKVFSAVKLELGDQQTLAHQENGVWVLNETPDYEEELIKCKTSTADPTDTYANKVISTNIPNKNLLDNWYFLNPVNQRGESSYSTDAAYTIDRWKLGGAAGTASVSSQGVLLTSSTAISQFFEQSRVMSGKTYTMSVLWSNGLSVATGPLTHGTQVSGWQIAVGGTVTTPGSCGIRAFSSNTFQLAIFGDGTNRVIAAKVELGTEQTLAHQENGAWVLNEIPDYGEELRKCQRYYIALKPRSGATPLIGTGMAVASTQAAVTIPLPVTLNGATVTPAKSGTLKLWHGNVVGSSSADITGFVGSAVSDNSATVTVTVSGGLNIGEVCALQFRSNDAALSFSCEL